MRDSGVVERPATEVGLRHVEWTRATDRGKNGRRWVLNTVRSILATPHYTGRLRTSGTSRAAARRARRRSWRRCGCGRPRAW
ncbi:recombinase family protein [Streptomyces sp. NPDC002405]|uniref:recombinase family protein n=1 Tax=unclassified Streptomyces TaxID=2593676 RepID=UPI0036A78486